MTRLTFVAEWHGEPAAGINAGSDEVVMTFRYGYAPDADTIEYWRTSVAEFYDGAKVTVKLVEQF